MKPIYLILYIVFITLLLTLVFPRMQQASARQKRFFWIAGAAGIAVLLISVFLIYLT